MWLWPTGPLGSQAPPSSRALVDGPPNGRPCVMRGRDVGGLPPGCPRRRAASDDKNDAQRRRARAAAHGPRRAAPCADWIARPAGAVARIASLLHLAKCAVSIRSAKSRCGLRFASASTSSRADDRRAAVVIAAADTTMSLDPIAPLRGQPARRGDEVRRRRCAVLQSEVESPWTRGVVVASTDRRRFGSRDESVGEQDPWNRESDVSAC